MAFALNLQMNDIPVVIFIVGPTAVGKSEIAIELAKRIRGEIVSADSMQIYRGMNIGTAKPRRAARKKVPHHLMDILAPSRVFSVYEYQRRAVKIIKEIAGRKKVPVVTGGTGLYVRSLLEGLTPQAGPNPALRRQLKKEARLRGTAALFERLKRLDPLKAGVIKPGDEKRIIRALEIIQQSNGSSLRAARGEKPLGEHGFKPLVIGISRDRTELYKHIGERVEGMFAQGLVKEVKNLLRGGMSRTARQAVGYRELLNVLKQKGLEAPRRTVMMDEAKALIKQNTRRLAKRQWTWFKKERNIRWITRLEGDTAWSLCDKIIREIKDWLGPQGLSLSAG